ncbi:MAG: hypothetical protein H7839_07510 [Magnetococcus sp. YQC-5]
MNVTPTAWLLSLMLLVAPFSMVWGAEKGREPPQIAKTASKVSLPVTVKASQRLAQIQKDRDELRKQIIAKKFKKIAAKARTKKVAKKVSHKKFTQRATKPLLLPTKIGIRTWAFPETDKGRNYKMHELKARITETENAYDAENALLQKLNREYTRIKSSQTGSAETLAPLEAQMSASKSRINDIMIQLDALHQQRNEVSDVVFLRTVRD